MKPLMSIIIPAYNIENYIQECILKIKLQTFTDYEVIIINDGSTDNTGNVVLENIKDDDRFFYIEQENCGAANARNVGIKRSRGKYITFVDGDDFYYDNFCLEKIAKKLSETNADVITYKMVMYYQNNNKYSEEKNITNENILYDKIYDYLDLTISNSKLSVSPCDKIIKNEILKENNIFFNDMKMLEDIDWSMLLYKHVNNIYIFNETIYVYRKQRNGSTTFSYNAKKLRACYDFINKWVCLPKDSFTELYLNYIAYQYVIFITVLDKNKFNKAENKNIKDLKWLLKYNKNYKTKKAYTVYRFLGYNGMVLFLKLYMFLKNKNIIRFK